MQNKRIFSIILAVLVAITAILPLVAAFLPYTTLKPLADSLMRDGNFKSLREDNALVFKILLGSGGLILAGIAVLIGSGRFQGISTWFSHFSADFFRFWRAMKPARDETVALIVLASIVVMAIIFRLVHINDGMSHDESYTFVVFGSGSLFNTITNYHLPNNHVLNSILIFVSTHLFGVRPWAVRLPALLAGLLIIPACYTLAKAIYDKYTALTSALAVSILPGAILYSSSGRGYTLVALFTLLTLWLADYVRRDKNRFGWFLLVLFSALGYYAVPVMLFPFGVVFTWLFLENLITGPGPYTSKIDFLKYWLIAGIGTAILVLLLYTPIFIYTGADKVFANHWVQPEAWTGYLGSLPNRARAVWHEWTGGMPSVMTILLLSGFALSLIFHRRIARQRFPLQAAAFIWIGTLVLIQRPIGVEKIWMFLQAPFMIWAAAGFMGLLKDVRLKFARNVSLAAIALGIAMLMVVANCIQVIPTLPERWAAKGPVENTVLFIKDRLGPKDLIIIDAPYDAATWYYSRLYGIPDSRFNKQLPFDHLFVIVSHRDGQTVDSVLQNRGPDPSLVDRGEEKLIVNFQNLDTYEIPHR